MSVLMSVSLDKRRVKVKTGTYPLILLVRINGNPYRYQTIFDLTEDEFAKLQSPRLNEKLQEIKAKLKIIQRGADEYLEKNSSFYKIDFENTFICSNLFQAKKDKNQPVYFRRK